MTYRALHCDRRRVSGVPVSGESSCFEADWGDYHGILVTIWLQGRYLDFLNEEGVEIQLISLGTREAG